MSLSKTLYTLFSTGQYCMFGLPILFESQVSLNMKFTIRYGVSELKQFFAASQLLALKLNDSAIF